MVRNWIRHNFEYLGYIVTLLIFYLSLQYVNRLNALLMCVSALIFFVIQLYTYVGTMKDKAVDYSHKSRIAAQFLSLDVIGIILLFPACIDCYKDQGAFRVLVMALGIAVGSYVIDACLMICSLKKLIKNMSDVSLINSIKDRVTGVIVAIIVFILSIEVIGVQQKWDNLIYARQLYEEHVFQLFNINGLYVCGHMTFGYLFSSMLLNSVFHDVTLSLTVFNVLLYTFSVYAFFSIVKELFKKRSSIEYFLATCVYAFSPFTFGMLGTINIDFPLIFFYVILLWAYVKKYKLIEILFATLFVFTKETAALVYASLYFAIIIYELYKYLKERNKSFDIVGYIQSIVLGLIWMKHYLGGGSWRLASIDSGLEVASSSDISINQAVEYLDIVEKSKLHYLGIDFEYMKSVFDNIFILNFNWLFILCMCIAVIVSIVRKSFSKIHLILLCGYIANLIPNLFYVTAVNFRYATIQTVFFTLFFVILCMNFEKRWIERGLLSVMALLMILSSFYTVDPITRYRYGVQEISEGQDRLRVWYSDNLTYNRNWVYFSKCLDEAVGTVLEMDPDALILLPASQGMSSDSWAIGGVWNSETLYYDYERQQINPLYGDNPLSIKYVDQDTDLENALNSGRNLYYIKVPNYGDKTLEHFRDNYSISKDKSILYRGWEIDLYHVNQG